MRKIDISKINNDPAAIADATMHSLIPMVNELIGRVVALEAVVLGGPVRPAQDASGEAVSLDDVLDEKVAAVLRENGFESVNAVNGATDEDLLAINGIGEKRCAQIREALK